MFARTERLLLRPSWPEDAECLFSAVADEAIVRNLAFAPWPYTYQNARDFAALEQDRLYPNFLLFRRTSGAPQLVGSCGLGNHQELPEIGYWIARPFWGLGYASEAARAVVDIARAIGHRHLVSGHFIDNPASGRVLRKIGFKPTGRIVPRHSLGRAASVPCALYEMSLQGVDAEGDRDAGDDAPFLPYDAQQIAA